MMARRMMRKHHVRCRAGEKVEITSKPYLSLYSEICHVLPQITLLQRNEMEKTVQIQVEWAEKFAE